MLSEKCRMIYRLMPTLPNYITSYFEYLARRAGVHIIFCQLCPLGRDYRRVQGRKSRVTAAPLNGFSRLLSVFAFILVQIQGLKSHNRHRICTTRESRRVVFYHEALQSIKVFDVTYHVHCYANSSLLETQRGEFICPDLDVCSEYKIRKIKEEINK